MRKSRNGMGDILIGTSGWSYKEWVGPFYSEAGDQLGQYFDVFMTVEVNSTFYSFPSAWLPRLWAKRSPNGFRFALKMPRDITHKKMLADPRILIEKFLKLVSPLKKAGRLGPLLFQLPPKLQCNISLLSKFLETLPEGYEYAVEFRHPSWFEHKEVIDLLRDHDVAFTIVDAPGLPGKVEVTSDFSYFRWHGRGSRPWYNYHYRTEELREFATKVVSVKSKCKRVYGYFNNHFKGFAPKNALELIELLDIGLTPKQIEVKARIDEWFSKLKGPALLREPEIPERDEVMSMNIKDLISILTDNSRLKRALSIPDKSVRITHRNEIIEAMVRDYRIVIDLKRKVILHDCADWGKVSAAKRFCKHVAKLIFTLPDGVEIMRSIILDFDKWNFRALMGGSGGS